MAEYIKKMLIGDSNRSERNISNCVYCYSIFVGKRLATYEIDSLEKG